MALRMLSDATKISLTQQAIGIVTVNGTIDGKKHAFRLDTTLPGVIYRCDCNTINDYCDDYATYNSSASEDSCPQYCSSGMHFKTIDTDYISVAAVKSKLAISNFSIPEFRAGRICDYYSNDLFDYDYDAYADSVLGLGPSKFSSDSEVTTELDSLPWSKYSIFLTESIKEEGSFLLTGDADADAIQGLTELKLAATSDKGWTLTMDNFLSSGVPVKSAQWNKEVTVSASTPLIRLPYSVWNEFKSWVDTSSNNCGYDFIGKDMLYSCPEGADLPRLGFMFGTQALYLDGQHYTMPSPSTEGRLTVMVAQSSAYDYADFVFGTPFLRTFYTVFDKAASTVTFYCKDGVNCEKNVDVSPKQWTKTVDISSDGVKNLHKMGYISALVGAAIVLLLAAMHVVRSRMRKQVNRVEESTEPLSGNAAYAEASTPSTNDDAEKPRASVFV